MNKMAGLMLGGFLIIVIIILTSPRVVAKNPEYDYIPYQQGYQKATVMAVGDCVQDGARTLCMAVIRKGDVELPTPVTGSVEIGDNVYKECRKKLGTSVCSESWKPWIGETYLIGGEI